MSSPLKATKISDNVWWVGAIDWDLRDFHGYSTDRGSSYNAFLIMDEKITLIDTVKKPFYKEMLSRIESIVDPCKIDYIVSNHAEMDHSGALPEIIEHCKPEKVFASAMGVKALEEHFHMGHSFETVKEGEKLSLGKRDLTFIDARMLHWPDSQFAYLSGDDVLFSNDAFGMHLASSERFADEVDASVINYELKKYFANILLPFSHLILKLLEKIEKFNFPTKIIATDHGPIWRKNLGDVLNLYEKWSKQEASPKAVIVYDTMWGSTETMAKAIEDGLCKGGAKVVTMPLRVSSRANVITELMDAGALIVGSSTLNNNILPPIADVMTYLKGLKPKNLSGAVFSSYGWSGESFKQLREILESMKVEIVHDGVNVKYVPDENVLNACHEMGHAIAKKLVNN